MTHLCASVTRYVIKCTQIQISFSYKKQSYRSDQATIYRKLHYLLPPIKLCLAHIHKAKQNMEAIYLRTLRAQSYNDGVIMQLVS